MAAGHLGIVEAGLAGHPELLGSYHLAVADHRAASLQPLLTSPPAQAVQVVEAYRRAEQDGAVLDVPRRRVLAEALVADGVVVSELNLEGNSIGAEGTKALARAVALFHSLSPCPNQSAGMY